MHGVVGAFGGDNFNFNGIGFLKSNGCIPNRHEALQLLFPRRTCAAGSCLSLGTGYLVRRKDDNINFGENSSSTIVQVN